MADFENANYADDSTPFSAKTNHKSVVQELELFNFIYMAAKQLYEGKYR